MRARFGWVIAGFVLMLGLAAHAREGFKVPQPSVINLLEESQRLNLMIEPAVQRRVQPINETFSMALGAMQVGQTDISTPYHATRYSSLKPYTMARVGFEKLPWNFHGQWGWGIDLSYGYRDRQQEYSRTTLHLMPIVGELVYRGRLKSGQLWAPFVAVGGGEMIFVQRGGDGYNTSGADGFGSASMGLWWGIGQWLTPDSMTPLDLSLRYRRIFLGRSDTANWNGDSFFLSTGVTL
jgi:hypothetical protein